MLIQVAILAALTASAASQAPACSWVETVSRWSNGQRNILKISVDQHYKGWSVTFTFDTPVTFEVRLEAELRSDRCDERRGKET